MNDGIAARSFSCLATCWSSGDNLLSSTRNVPPSFIARRTTPSTTSIKVAVTLWPVTAVHTRGSKPRAASSVWNGALSGVSTASWSGPLGGGLAGGSCDHKSDALRALVRSRVKPMLNGRMRKVPDEVNTSEGRVSCQMAGRNPCTIVGWRPQGMARMLIG